MPIYEIQHAISLSDSQKDALAEAITKIHSTKFTTPKLFVQLYYTDVSQRETYIGGKRRTGNHIRGQVRSGPSRSQEEWDDLCKEFANAWDEIVGKPVTNGSAAKGQADTSLRSVILMGGMVGGLEIGFVLPPAGGDVEWLHRNMDAFKEKAEQGDEDMVDLVKEVEQRGLLDGTNGYKTAAQRLEEMLGWGDSA